MRAACFTILPFVFEKGKIHIFRFSKLPSFSGGNNLAVVWSISSMVLLFSYTSTLLASLVVVEFEEPIDDMKQLLHHVKENNRGKVVFPRGSTLLKSLQESARPGTNFIRIVAISAL